MTTFGRTFVLALTTLAILLTACGSSNPGKPSPTVLGTQGPAQETEKPELPHY